MTSLGGRICDDGGWMPTFKVQGQVYHRIGSLEPLEDNTVTKFLQIYFIADTDAEIETRCKMEGVSFDCKPRVNRGVVTGLSHMLNEHNPYVRDFKAVAQWNNEDDEIQDFQVVIHADKKPVAQH